MGYQRPVPYSRSTSWAAHRRRNPPSSEPGIDMFVPIGTPVLAAESGRVAHVGDSIAPATGRFVTIDLDDGRRVRYLHLSRRTVSVGQRVSRGQVIGYSGATGYGEEDWSWNVAETGGAHVHMTLWPLQRYVFGSNGTLDPEPYFDPDGSPAGKAEEDDMFSDEDRDRQKRIDQGLKDLSTNLAEIKGALLNGMTDDLSTPRIQRAIDGVIDLQNRFVIDVDGDGRDDYDLTQLNANEIKPMLLTLLASIGRPTDAAGAPINVEALAAAIRKGLPDEIADELAERLGRGSAG